MRLLRCPRWLGIFLALTVVGCSSRIERPPSVLAVSPPTLVVRADFPSPGSTRLQVLREWTRDLEQEAALRFSLAAGSSGNPDVDNFLGYLAVFGIVIVVAIVGGVIYLGAKAIWRVMEPSPSPGRSIRFQQTLREPVLRATVERANGGPVLDLGLQPVEGYVLDEDMLQSLGGPGAEVIFRDHELSITYALPAPR